MEKEEKTRSGVLIMIFFGPFNIFVHTFVYLLDKEA
jgi:hypothetical protein